MASLLPGITDDEANIQAVVAAAHEHKAQYLGANVLFLKPGSKEWFMPYIKEAYPHLTSGYSRIYRQTYAPQEYTSRVLRVVDEARRRWGLPTTMPTRRLQGPQMQMELALTA